MSLWTALANKIRGIPHNTNEPRKRHPFTGVATVPPIPECQVCGYSNCAIDVKDGDALPMEYAAPHPPFPSGVHPDE